MTAFTAHRLMLAVFCHTQTLRDLKRIADMPLQFTTMAEIIDKEHSLAADAPVKYDRLHEFSVRALDLLVSDFGTVKRSHRLFAAEMAIMRKHAILAYLSAVRRHRGQCALNLRIMLEYASVACYALAEPDDCKIIGTDNDGKLIRDDKTKERSFKWMNVNYPKPSAIFKLNRDAFNKYEAHGGVLGTRGVFDWGQEGGEVFEMTFFDEGEPDLVPLSLWQVGDFAMGVLATLLEVNSSYKTITLYQGVGDQFNMVTRLAHSVLNELKAPGGVFQFIDVDEPPAG